MFVLEDKDREILLHPKKAILDDGGVILFVESAELGLSDCVGDDVGAAQRRTPSSSASTPRWTSTNQFHVAYYTRICTDVLTASFRVWSGCRRAAGRTVSREDPR